MEVVPAAVPHDLQKEMFDLGVFVGDLPLDDDVTIDNESLDGLQQELEDCKNDEEVANILANGIKLRDYTKGVENNIRQIELDSIQVIPAIEAVWPEDNGIIYIQQDNAKTHVLPDDEIFQEAVAESGLDIMLIQQPPNSPDMNVLDLCFFNSIQSLALESAPTTLQELILSVEEAFNRYDPLKLDRAFITWQSCMVEVMKEEGGNGYKIPHMNKEKLQREGQLPMALRCDGELYQKSLEKIAQFVPNVH